MLGIIALIYSPKAVEVTVRFFLGLGKKFKIIRNVDDKLRKFQRFSDEYRNEFSLIRNNKTLLTRVTLMTFIQLTGYFMVSYLVYRAVYLNKGTMVEIISLQAILYFAVSFIPTPGTLGASEAGYYTLYRFLFAVLF